MLRDKFIHYFQQWRERQLSPDESPNDFYQNH